MQTGEEFPGRRSGEQLKATLGIANGAHGKQPDEEMKAVHQNCSVATEISICSTNKCRIPSYLKKLLVAIASFSRCALDPMAMPSSRHSGANCLRATSSLS